MVLGKLQRARRKVLNRIVPFKCILGDQSNNPYTPEAGYYWVRRFDRADANGNSTPGNPFRVRSGTALVVPRGGRQVWVGTGLDGHLTVLGFVHEDLVSANVNIDPRSAQPNDPYRQWIRLKDIQNFRALPIGTGNTPSMKVQVRQLFYYTETGDLVRWNGTNADTHIDLSAERPGAGLNLQCYAVLWLRTYNPNGLDDIQVTVSTPIDDLNLDLSFDDLQECAEAADADAIPIQAFRLYSDQTALKLDDTVDVDLRQFINMPQVYGFPNDVARQYRIHENHSVVMPEVVTLSTGGGIQIQAGGVLVILDIEPDEDDGGDAPGVDVTDATYLLQVADGDLPNAQAMGALATGLVKNTTTTGVQSIAVAGTDYTSPAGTENLSNKTITASSLIATALSLLIGGFKAIFTHANSADRTYTLPDASGTIALTSDIPAAITALTGDVTATGPGSAAATLANSGVSATTYIKPTVTFDAKGRATAAETGVMGVILSVRLAASTALPACTYANGTSGVGATLTANANGALTVDGVSVATSDRVLIFGQASGLQNGVYVVTQTGSAGTPFILTRATDSDTSDELLSSVVLVRTGSSNSLGGNIFWCTNASAITLGTTAITYNGGFAFRALGNLSTTNINKSLLFNSDDSYDVGSFSEKVHQFYGFGVEYEETTTPSTPSTNDYNTYAKASGNGGALFGIDDTGAELQVSPQIAIIADSQTSGTNAGATTTTTWVTRPIQTEVSDPHALVTLSSNKFTPVAGVYDAEVFATVIANASAATLAAHRLFNVTSTTELAKSANVRLVADTGATASFRTRITANGTDEFRVDTYVTSGRATTGLGQAVSTGSNEIYTIIVLRKIG